MHMTIVRIIPLQPTNAPDTTRALLESINPAALVENPERLFKKLMETGMSPPPIAMTAMTP
jgi:hypothetical protein